MATETVNKKNIKKKEPAPKKKEYKVAKELDPRMLVPVHNGFGGTLVYRSRKTGELFVWEHFGHVQDIELGELKTARGANRAYFENNWFLIDDPEILEYLNVLKYYKNALTIEEFDDLFKMDPDDIGKRIATLSAEQKNTVKYRAKQLIEEKEIDSLSVIEALEKHLGVQLVER